MERRDRNPNALSGDGNPKGSGTSPSYKPMSLPMRLVLAFVAANAFAGAASLMLFPAATDAGFFWALTPPVSAAMFGTLYLSAGGLVAWAALKGVWETARYLAPMIVVFSALMLTATLLHLHRFDPGVRLLYWLAVYVTALLAGIYFYLRHERGGAVWAVRGQRTPPAVRSVTLGVSLLAAAFAVVGFALPELVMSLWPWTLTPLTTQAFLAWVGAFAAGLLWVAYDPDRKRTRPIGVMLVATAALLAGMLLMHRGDLEPDPLGVGLFALGLLGMGLLGGFMLASGRGQERPASGEVARG